MKTMLFAVAAAALAGSAPAAAAPFFFSTGDPDGRMATASRPDNGPGQFEIETGDDFLVTRPIVLNGATLHGLLIDSGLSDIGQVRLEIYRVFPLDSDVGRTSGPPTFSTDKVPTRVNSPSDVELVDRDTASGNLSFSTTVLADAFTANNSVQPGGIHAKPDQTTGGDAAVTGEEVLFDFNFANLFLPAGHYFFVPQIQVTNGGEFLWLSAAKPIVGGTGPFLPDLQSWTRDGTIDPDWLRVGTDIVGGTTPPTFDASFSLAGVLPEPASLALIGIGLVGLAFARRRN